MFTISNTGTFYNTNKRKWAYLINSRIKIICSILFIIIISNLLFCSKNKKNNCIVIYGDTRKNHPGHRVVVKAIEKVNPTDIFHVGDFVTDGLIFSEWQISNQITSKIRKNSNFYSTLGNHDSNSKFYFENFNLPGNERYYSVDINIIHFIVLDSNHPFAESKAQSNWLINDLKNIPLKTKFLIAIFHHPPYSSGAHGNETRLHKAWIPIFEKYKVDIIFNGHDHNYERLYKNGIYYIVTGGGGAPLRDKATQNPYSQKFIKTLQFCRLSIHNNQLLVEVLNPDLKIIDTLKIIK